MTVLTSDGNIFDLKPSIVLVNPVNGIGVCGAGLAKAFAYNYPINYQLYQDWAKPHHPREVGDALTTTTEGRTIINVVTKKYPRDNSTLEGVKACLETLPKQNTVGKVIALPALGYGCGRLKDFTLIKDMVETLTADNLDYTFILFTPRYVPHR